MQRMIMISEERYDRMIESYDKAMEELKKLREQLQAVKVCESPLRTVLNNECRKSASMQSKATGEEVRTIRSMLKVTCERTEYPDDVAHELEVYNLMDRHECDMDTAELLTQDQEEEGR